MEAKSSELSTPGALREVWAWNDALYNEMKELTTADALRRMQAETAAVRQTFALALAAPRLRACVGEARGSYDAKPAAATTAIPDSPVC